MNLVVTGASGFVGRGLLPILATEGHAGVATGRTPPQGLPAGWIGKTRDEVLNSRSFTDRIEAIVHLEVKQHIPRPTQDDITAFNRVNVEGTRSWTEWASVHSVERFILVSSIKAAGSGPGLRREDDADAPNTPYGRSKAAAEDVVRTWAKDGHGRVGTILRSAPVYGPGNEANLSAFVRQIARGQPCYIGDGTTRKSIVSRRNLVAAIQFALKRTTPGYEVFNVADVEVLSVKELATVIAELGHYPKPWGMPLFVAQALAPIGDVVERLTRRDFPLTTARLNALREESVFPCEKLIDAGFCPPYSLRDGLEEMLAWTADAELKAGAAHAPEVCRHHQGTL